MISFHTPARSYEWMPCSLQRRRRNGSVRRGSHPRPVGSDLSWNGGGDAGAHPGRRPTAARMTGPVPCRSTAPSTQEWTVLPLDAGNCLDTTIEKPRLLDERGASGQLRMWSGRWDSNPRPSAWQADALAAELRPHHNAISKTRLSGVRSAKSQSFWILRRPSRPRRPRARPPASR